MLTLRSCRWVLNWDTRLSSFITTCVCGIRCYVILLPLRSRALLGRRVLVGTVVGCGAAAALSASIPFLVSNSSLYSGSTKYHYNSLVGFCFFSLAGAPHILHSLLIEGVFLAPFLTATATCCILVPVLRSRAHHMPINGAGSDAGNRPAILSIIRITVFALVCYTPQLAWAIVDKICNVMQQSCVGDTCR